MSDIVLDMEGSVMKTHCLCCQRAPSLVGETDRYRVSAWDGKFYYRKIE